MRVEIQRVSRHRDETSSRWQTEGVSRLNLVRSDAEMKVINVQHRTTLVDHWMWDMINSIPSRIGSL